MIELCIEHGYLDHSHAGPTRSICFPRPRQGRRRSTETQAVEPAANGDNGQVREGHGQISSGPDAVLGGGNKCSLNLIGS